MRPFADLLCFFPGFSLFTEALGPLFKGSPLGLRVCLVTSASAVLSSCLAVSLTLGLGAGFHAEWSGKERGTTPCYIDSPESMLKANL